MEWIPFVQRPVWLPLHPVDLVTGDFHYSAINPVRGNFSPSCSYARCLQNFVEFRFELGRNRIMCFHGGLN